MNREKWIQSVRNPEFLKQHTVKSIKSALDGLATFSQVKHGDIKKGEGDIVIINFVEIEDMHAMEWLKHTRDIKEVKTVGRYTNLYFGDKFFDLSLKYILESK